MRLHMTPRHIRAQLITNLHPCLVGEGDGTQNVPSISTYMKQCI